MDEPVHRGHRHGLVWEYFFPRRERRIVGTAAPKLAALAALTVLPIRGPVFSTIN